MTRMVFLGTGLPVRGAAVSAATAITRRASMRTVVVYNTLHLYAEIIGHCYWAMGMLPRSWCAQIACRTCEFGCVPDLGAATCGNMVRWPFKGVFGGSSDVVAIRWEWRGVVHERVVLLLASIAASIVCACNSAVMSRVHTRC